MLIGEYVFALLSMQQKTIEKGRPGRKPGKDNKIPVTIYIEQSVIERLGKGFIISGKDKARAVAVDSIYEAHKNLIQK